LGSVGVTTGASFSGADHLSVDAGFGAGLGHEPTRGTQKNEHAGVHDRLRMVLILYVGVVVYSRP
jgi:hypothetical protein